MAVVLFVTVSLMSAMSALFAVARVDAMGMLAIAMTMTMSKMSMDTVTVTVVTLGRYVAVLMGLSITTLSAVVVFMAVFLVKGILGALAILLLAAIALLVTIRLSTLVAVMVVVVSGMSKAALLAMSISAAMDVTVMTLGVIMNAVFAMGVH